MQQQPRQPLAESNTPASPALKVLGDARNLLDRIITAVNEVIREGPLRLALCDDAAKHFLRDAERSPYRRLKDMSTNVEELKLTVLSHVLLNRSVIQLGTVTDGSFIPLARASDAVQLQAHQHADTLLVFGGDAPTVAARVVAEHFAVQRCFATAAVHEYSFDENCIVPLLLPEGADKGWAQRRFVAVRSAATEFVRAIAGTLTTKTVVLRGASGSGKTHNAIAVAHRELNGTCLYINFADNAVKGKVQPVEVRVAPEGAAPLASAARDRAVERLVMDLVLSAVPEQYRNPPSPQQKHAQALVIVFDEVAEHPAVVRGLVSLFVGSEFRSKIARQLCMTPRGESPGRSHRDDGVTPPVYAIITGTGVEGHQHVVSVSQPNAYELRVAEPHAWDQLQLSVPRAVRDVLSTPSRPGLVRAQRMVRGNARLAALFCNGFKVERPWVAPETRTCAIDHAFAEKGLVKRAPALAIHSHMFTALAKFKQLNGLEDLDGDGVIAALVEAMCAQTKDEIGPDMFRSLCCRYGLLVDYAVLVPTRPPNYKPATQQGDQHMPSSGASGSRELNMTLFVPESFTVRYALDEAMAMVPTLLLHGEDSAFATWDGFERMAARFIEFTHLFATSAVKFDADRVRSIAQAAPYKPLLPAGWAPPLTVVECFQQGGQRVPILTATCTGQLGRTAVETVLGALRLDDFPRNDAGAGSPRRLEALTALGRADLGVLFINAPSAPYADIIAALPGGTRGGAAATHPQRTLMLCQCKFYATTDLTELDVFAELHKMGHRGQLSVAAAMIDAMAKATNPSQSVLALRQRHTGSSSYQKLDHFRGLMADYAAPPTDSAKPSSACAKLHKAWSTHARDFTTPNPTTEMLKGYAKASEVVYVLLLHGKPPPAISVAAAQLEGVRLLWAPLVLPKVTSLGNGDLQAAAARNLLGFYPLPLAEVPPPIDGATFVPQLPL